MSAAERSQSAGKRIGSIRLTVGPLPVLEGYRALLSGAQVDTTEGETSISSPGGDRPSGSELLRRRNRSSAQPSRYLTPLPPLRFRMIRGKAHAVDECGFVNHFARLSADSAICLEEARRLTTRVDVASLGIWNVAITWSCRFVVRSQRSACPRSVLSALQATDHAYRQSGKRV